MKWKCSDLKCIRKPTRSRLSYSLTHLPNTNPAVEHSKIVRWSESPCNQSGRKGKGLWLVIYAFPSRYRACKLFNIRLYATVCFNYFRWHHRMFSYCSVFELLICWLRNGVFNLLLGENYTQGKTKLSRKSENAVADDRVLKFLQSIYIGQRCTLVFVWRRLTSCWILSAMSPEIQEWSHKSRSRINNLYLLTHPVNPVLTYLQRQL